MRIIPVMDLLNGVVVRAVRGERERYRPIVSALCESADPLHVARILLERCGSRKLYVADLDALRGETRQTGVLRELLAGLPAMELWLDGGFASPEEAQAQIAALAPHGARVTPIFGSESLRDPKDAERCFADPQRAILSLDRRGGEPLDPASCWTTPARWPARVIVMTLDRVGAFAGPDLATFSDVRRRAPHVQLIGAGGIRDSQDLAAAQRAGASAWLVASALHDLRLSAWRAEGADASVVKTAPR